MKKLSFVLMIIITILSCNVNIFGSGGYTTKSTPCNNSFKAYMSYKTITNISSSQYKLQQRATTGKYGIRTVNGRYCIAVGSYYTTTIGTKIDIVMENSNIIQCVLGDVKADAHTDSLNRANPNGCIIEFLVDMNTLDKTCKRMGDMSYVPSGGLKGEIKYIRVYDEVI